MLKKGRGSIVNISSAQAIRPSPGQSNYAASKWAVRGLTKVAASELGPMIRVNSVHPGPIDTPMISEMLKTNLSVLQGLIAETPLERVGTAEEVNSLERGIAVSPGKHTVTVSRPGMRERNSEIEVAEGETGRLETEGVQVLLLPLEGPRPGRDRDRADR